MATSNTAYRVGIVSSVDSGAKQARVIYPDAGNMVSGWLYVLQTSAWMPNVNDRVLCLVSPATDSDGYILGAIP